MDHKLNGLRTPRPSTFSLLDLPADPLDTRALEALPLRTLRALTDRVYHQLDSEHPCAHALEWYSALAGEWARRSLPASRHGVEETGAEETGSPDYR